MDSGVIRRRLLLPSLLVSGRQIGTQRSLTLASRSGEARTALEARRGSGMYLCWGASPEGLLRQRPAARGSPELRQAASGERHSLLLLSDGTVHSGGDNSRGQLGRRGVQRDERPSECGGKGARRGAGQGVPRGPGLRWTSETRKRCSALLERKSVSFVSQLRGGFGF